MSNSSVAQIYMVKIGDTLPSIAKQVYGDPSYASAIANSNGISPNAVLPIGSRLAIPSISSGLGADTVDETIVVTPENAGKTYYGPGPVETTSSSLLSSTWYKDWRTYAIAGLVLGGLWLMFRKKR